MRDERSYLRAFSPGRWDGTRRRAALPHWLEHYNERRPHSGIGDRPPLSRVHNVRGQDS